MTLTFESHEGRNEKTNQIVNTSRPQKEQLAENPFKKTHTHTLYAFLSQYCHDSTTPDKHLLISFFFGSWNRIKMWISIPLFLVSLALIFCKYINELKMNELTFLWV